MALVEAYVIVREEIYTLAQLRKVYDDLKNNKSRSIDIKATLMERFEERIKIGKLIESVKTILEYVYLASINFTTAKIYLAWTGNGLEIPVILKMLLKGYQIKLKLVLKFRDPQHFNK